MVKEVRGVRRNPRLALYVYIDIYIYHVGLLDRVTSNTSPWSAAWVPCSRCQPWAATYGPVLQTIWPSRGCATSLETQYHKWDLGTHVWVHTGTLGPSPFFLRLTMKWLCTLSVRRKECSQTAWWDPRARWLQTAVKTHLCRSLSTVAKSPA